MSELRKILRDEALLMSGETAPNRRGPSVPARILVENNLIIGPIFDWGCGHGVDVEYFRQNGIEAYGWDPIHNQENKPELFPKGYFGFVNCAFVLNTLPDMEQRKEVIKDIYNFLPEDGYLILTLRAKQELKRKIKSTWKKYGDGYITSKGTFQKGYTSDEAVKLVEPLFTEVMVLNNNPVVITARK